MKILCTQREKQILEHMIAVARKCLCHGPEDWSHPKCRDCLLPQIEWTENSDRLIEYGDNPTV